MSSLNEKRHGFAADANIDVVTIQYLFCGGFALSPLKKHSNHLSHEWTVKLTVWCRPNQTAVKCQ